MPLYKVAFVSEFFKYLAALLSSNVLAQAIAFVVYPFITRIYGREAFGEFNLFFSIVGLLTIISTGKYDLAILLPKSEKNAISLFQLSILFNIVFFAVTTSLVFTGKEWIATLFNQEKLASFLPLLPFLVLLGGLWQTINYYLVRQKKYYNISAYNIFQSCINSGMKCLLGMKGLIQSGLIWGTFLGQFLAIFICFFKSGFPFRKIVKFDKTEMLNMAKVYSNFPKYQLPNELINFLSGNLPIFLLSAHFEMAEIGLFSLALTLGFRPANIFCNTIYLVMFKKMSERFHNKENMKKDLFLFCKTCVIGILPFFLVLMFISEWVFSWLFGMEWKEAGLYLKYMLPWLFMVVLTSSLCFVPELFFKQKTAMNIEIIQLILRLISLFTGIYKDNFHLGIILYSSVSVLMIIIKLIWYFELVKKYEKTIINI